MRIMIIVLFVLFVAGMGCGKDEPLLHKTNHPPTVTAIHAEPDSVRMNSLTTITVTASDPDGDSLSYSWSAPSGSFIGVDSTEAHVQWRAPLAASTVQLTVEVSDGEARAASHVSVVVVPPTGSIEGTVTRADTQAPIEGVVVALGDAQATTDAEGHYQIDDLPAGIVLLHAEKEGFEDYDVGINITADQTFSHDFELLVLVPHGRVSGKVTNSLGEAVPAAACALDTVRTTATVDGRYEFLEVRYGAHTLRVTEPGYAEHVESIELSTLELVKDVVLDAIPLPAPTNVIATEGEAFAIHVSWVAPPVDAPIRGYILYQSDNGATYAPVQAEPLGPTTLSYDLTGMESHRYRYYVTAVNLENEEGNPSALSNMVVPTTLTPLVLIPASSVIMGNTPTGWGSEVHPGNPVFVGSFRLETMEVSNEQYLAFLLETYTRGTVSVSTEDQTVNSNGQVLLSMNASRIKFDAPSGLFTIVSGFDQHPVVGVTWYGADAYARYIGRRLPTEAEWEKAARGTSTDQGMDNLGNGYGMKYPWGMTLPTSGLANYGGFLGGTRAVDSFSSGAQTFWGTPIHNLAGNVWEWCADWSASYHSPHQPPSNGTLKVLRGGSYRDVEGYLRAGSRFSMDPAVANPTGGFRCAANP